MVDVSSGQLLKFDRKLTGTQWCSRLCTKNLKCHLGLKLPILWSESFSKRLKNYVKIKNRVQCSLPRHSSSTVPDIALLVRMKLLCHKTFY